MIVVSRLRELLAYDPNTGRVTSRRNRSGFLGVSWHEGAWRSVIQVDGVSRHLGRFATAEDAHRAYLQAKQTLHPSWEGS